MSNFNGPKICKHCGYYAQVRHRTRLHSWHVAEWGECRKDDLAKTGTMTPENATCGDFTPDPRRWPNQSEQLLVMVSPNDYSPDLNPHNKQ
jgi:hypothetical protein